MSGPDETELQPGVVPEAASVLAKLPRTRPQRSSARRAAARASGPPAEVSAASAPTSSNGHAPTDTPTSARKRAPRTRTATGTRAARSTGARSVRVGAPAPRQGFECEGERASRTVHPPGGAEMVASAAEIVGELAKAGLSAGERLLKDALSRLPLS